MLRAVAPDDLLAEPPRRAILRLATPTTLVMVVASTSNILNTYFVSRLGADAIAAVSLVFPMALLATTAMAGGIGSGVASAVARALGGGRREGARLVAEHALVLAVALGLGFGLAVLLGAPALFALMGGRGAVLDAATRFARVLFGGAAITFVGGMFDSILRGEGNVRVPAVWSTVSLVLQIALTPVLMFGAGLGLVGAPVAVLTSQLLATIPRARHVLGGRGAITPRPWPRTVSAAPLREILRVGIPATLSTTVTYLGVMVLTGIVARVGDAPLAAYGLGTRLDFLLLSFVYGFGAAVLTLAGLATGAGHPQRAAAYVRGAVAIIVVLLAVPASVLCWRPSLWIGIFTHDPAILDAGASYLRTIGPSYPLLGVAMLISFAFQGLGRATLPLAWMLVRVTGVVSVAVIAVRGFGASAPAVFAIIAAGNVLSGAVLIALFARTTRRLHAGRG